MEGIASHPPGNPSRVAGAPPPGPRPILTGRPATPTQQPPSPPMPASGPGAPPVESIPIPDQGPNIVSFPTTGDRLVDQRIKAGSKTPWAHAYPGIADWLTKEGFILENRKGSPDTQKD